MDITLRKYRYIHNIPINYFLTVPIWSFYFQRIFFFTNFNSSNFSCSLIRYETSNGISRQEQAELKNAGTDQEALNVKGSVTWTAPDGQVFTLNFVADENGYRPEGAHIPKA